MYCLQFIEVPNILSAHFLTSITQLAELLSDNVDLNQTTQLSYKLQNISKTVEVL